MTSPTTKSWILIIFVLVFGSYTGLSWADALTTPTKLRWKCTFEDYYPSPLSTETRCQMKISANMPVLLQHRIERARTGTLSTDVTMSGSSYGGHYLKIQFMGMASQNPEDHLSDHSENLRIALETPWLRRTLQGPVCAHFWYNDRLIQPFWSGKSGRVLDLLVQYENLTTTIIPGTRMILGSSMDRLGWDIAQGTFQGSGRFKVVARLTLPVDAEYTEGIYFDDFYIFESSCGDIKWPSCDDHGYTRCQDGRCAMTGSFNDCKLNTNSNTSQTNYFGGIQRMTMIIVTIAINIILLGILLKVITLIRRRRMMMRRSCSNGVSAISSGRTSGQRSDRPVTVSDGEINYGFQPPPSYSAVCGEQQQDIGSVPKPPNYVELYPFEEPPKYESLQMPPQAGIIQPSATVPADAAAQNSDNPVV